jgi:hypothetical protein
MINRYDRGAQTLSDLNYAPFPDIARAIPELSDARLATRLATATKEAIRDSAETLESSATSIVGAIGFEPTTPTVSKQRRGVSGRFTPCPQ